MRMTITRWCLISVLGASLLGAGCNIAGTSTQEDLGRGIVRGTLGAQPAGDVRLARPTNTDSFTGQVAAVEGGPMWFRKSVATSVVWPMMKILESIAQPMSGIGLKCSSMAKVAPSLFGILITTNNCSNQSWRVIWAEQ